MVILTSHDHTNYLVPDLDLDVHTLDRMEEIIRLRKVIMIRMKTAQDIRHLTGNFSARIYSIRWFHLRWPHFSLCVYLVVFHILQP